ncbi:hypothetical protein BCR43DRAFT_6590 [Syncephalastrum racemosum]|uniref:Uncharacterized protein n=1 Tax=Syncephalastrum racemosum TaxID=13706 RepID=A0A1X2HS06_SYNRA|nr:hypothetical protein BCR43DRAFT_6590 [Syncephalastrum racemosum]
MHATAITAATPLLILFLGLPSSYAHQVVVNCTWPCPVQGDVCVVTNTTVQCGPPRNSQWVLSQPTRSPIFVGEIARRLTPCVTCPFPSLPEHDAEEEVVSNNQTVIAWPPSDPKRPLDSFLSDCDEATFCEDAMCTDKIQPNGQCVSSNQCTSNRCVNGMCASSSAASSSTGDDPWATSHVSSDKSSDTTHRAIIIAVVISVVVLLALLSYVFYYLYRRKRAMAAAAAETQAAFNKDITFQYQTSSSSSQAMPLALLSSSIPQQQRQQIGPSPSSLSPTSSTRSHSSSASHQERHQPNYEVLNPSNHLDTPTRQQMQLQYQLHQQHFHAGSDLPSQHPPPPPYSP